MVQKHTEEREKQQQRQAQNQALIEQDVQSRKLDEEKDALADITLGPTEQVAFMPENELHPFPSFDDEEQFAENEESEPEIRNSGGTCLIYIPMRIRTVTDG